MKLNTLTCRFIIKFCSIEYRKEIENKNVNKGGNDDDLSGIIRSSYDFLCDFCDQKKKSRAVSFAVCNYFCLHAHQNYYGSITVLGYRSIHIWIKIIIFKKKYNNLLRPNVASLLH